MENDRTANDAFSTTDIETATIKSPPEASSPILMLEGDTLDTSKVKDEKVADQQPPETDGTTEAERSSSESSDSSDSSDSDDSNDKELEEEIKKIRDSGMDEENEAVEGASIKSKNEVVVRISLVSLFPLKRTTAFSLQKLMRYLKLESTSSGGDQHCADRRRGDRRVRPHRCRHRSSCCGEIISVPRARNSDDQS